MIYTLPDDRHLADYSGRETSSTSVPLRAEIAKANEECWVEGQWDLSTGHIVDCQVESAELGRLPFHASAAHTSFLKWPAWWSELTFPDRGAHGFS
jgi:hypothetical protein